MAQWVKVSYLHFPSNLTFQYFCNVFPISNGSACILIAAAETPSISVLENCSTDKHFLNTLFLEVWRIDNLCEIYKIFEFEIWMVYIQGVLPRPNNFRYCNMSYVIYDGLPSLWLVEVEIIFFLQTNLGGYLKKVHTSKLWYLKNSGLFHYSVNMI